MGRSGDGWPWGRDIVLRYGVKGRREFAFSAARLSGGNIRSLEIVDEQGSTMLAVVQLASDRAADTKTGW